MTPNEHFHMLKQAEYAPAPPPTMDTMKDNRGWFSRNLGSTLGTAASAGIGLAGLLGAPFTGGLSLAGSLALDAGLMGGGALFDRFTKGRELNKQRHQWAADEYDRENKAVRSGDYFGNNGSIAGMASQMRQAFREPAAPQMQGQLPASPAPVAPQPAAPPPVQ